MALFSTAAADYILKANVAFGKHAPMRLFAAIGMGLHAVVVLVVVAFARSFVYVYVHMIRRKIHVLTIGSYEFLLSPAWTGWRTIP